MVVKTLIDLLLFRWECVGGYLSVVEIADIWCGLHYVFAVVLWLIVFAVMGGILWLVGVDTRQPHLPVASIDFAAFTPCLTVDSALC